MNKREFINKIYDEWIIPHPSLDVSANLLNTVSDDIFTEQRLLFELIQNADDECINNDKEVSLNFSSNWLAISHNGRPFNERDIKALTSAWNGTKKKEKSKTWYKWIGFKSVFSISNKVSIFSDWYNFSFDKKYFDNNNKFENNMPWHVIPIWLDNNNVDKNIIDNYSVTTFLELDNVDKFKEEVDKLLSSENILLFLRNINKISVSIDWIHSYSIKKEINVSWNIFDSVSIYKNNIEISKWIVKTFWNIEISGFIHNKLDNEEVPDKLKESDDIEFSFAAKIVNDKIVLLKETESLIFTYLPTKESKYGFPFIVNANFDVDASRESVKVNSDWNIWLFKLIGEKLFDWLELLSTSEYKYQVLNLLPNKFTGNLNNKLMDSFNDSFDNSIKSKNFILNKDNQLKKVSDILIDKTWLTKEDFLIKKDLLLYINESKKKEFNDFSIIHDNLEQKNKLSTLGIESFKIDDLLDFLSDDKFKLNHDINNNYKLINYLFVKSTENDSKDFDKHLKFIDFIYSIDNNLHNVENISFPSFIGYSNKDIKVIHNDIYNDINNNKEIKEWLEQLWVSEASDDVKLKNILNDLDTYINQDNYLKNTRFLFKKYKEWKFDISDYDILNDLKILTTKGNLIKVCTSYLSDIYEPKLKLEESLDEDIFISEEYIENNDLESEWKAFFIRIWWLDEINIFKDNNRNNNSDLFKEYLKINVEEIKSEHRYAYKISENNYVNFNNIKFMDYTINYKFSKLFWDYIIKNINLEDINEKAKMDWGHYGSSEPMNSYIIWFFNNAKIFPNSTGECLKASDIFINNDEVKEFVIDYLPVLDNNIDIENSLIKQIWFKTELLLEDYLLILEKISEDVDENGLCENEKLIWKIYNKLIKKIKDITEEDKKLINNWGIKNKILSVNWKFESVTKLSFINNNFSIKNHELELVLVPNNCNKDLKQLFKLFWVIILDNPILENDNDKVENIYIKNKLFLILPYLSIIIEKDQYRDSEKEYDRIATIINNITFYNLDNINLLFKKESIDIRTSSDNTYIENKNFYFKWDWNKLFVLWYIVKDLSKLLNISNYVMELQQLLWSDEEDILNWFEDLGYDIWKLVNKPEYLKSKELIINNNLAENIPNAILSKISDNSSEDFRISVNNETLNKVLEELKIEGCDILNRKIECNIIKWIINSKWLPITIIVKSCKWKDNLSLPINPVELKEWLKYNSYIYVEKQNGNIEKLSLLDIDNLTDFMMLRLDKDKCTNKELEKVSKIINWASWVHFIYDITNTSNINYKKIDKKYNNIIESTSDDIGLL
jgi:hypothetical protein